MIFNNKRASAYWFIYVLAFAMLLILMFIIFNQTLQVYIYPTTQFLVNGTSTTTARADTFLGFWEAYPIIMIIIILFFLFLKSTQNDNNTFQ